MPELKFPTKIAALLTDFGTADNYAGVMKGVILKHAPDARLVDLCHNLPPFDVRAGAFQLMTAIPYFPPGTLFVCVVDPEVGGRRRLIYAEADGYRFLSPDNGLLSYAFINHSPSIILELNTSRLKPDQVSRTFHGRDILAPLAGRILAGVSPFQLGRSIEDFVRIPFPVVRKSGSKWTAEVIYVDGFGNCVTNIPSRDLLSISDHSRIWFKWGMSRQSLRGLVQSYSDVGPGMLLAIAGSHGLIEIAVREGNASQKTKLQTGSSLSLHFRL